jgi:hypothetical protein
MWVLRIIECKIVPEKCSTWRQHPDNLIGDQRADTTIQNGGKNGGRNYYPETTIVPRQRGGITYSEIGGRQDLFRTSYSERIDVDPM